MDERAADVTYGVSNGRTHVCCCCSRCSNTIHHRRGGLELKLAIMPVRPLKLGAGRAKHRGQDPAARAHGKLVDNIVSEHWPELFACRRCLSDRPHTQPDCCESTGQQGGNR